ncbi:MAG: MaoC family dehydratase N-terminal domain-containing protein [Actinomycetes bacterium]
MLDPDLVGRTFVGATSTLVTQEAITQFSRAIGEPNFEIAAPTFSISITLAESQVLLQESGLDWTRVVHGDQKFEIFRPIVAGDSLICSSTIETFRVVAGNEIVTVRSDLHSGAELVISSWSTLVVRA